MTTDLLGETAEPAPFVDIPGAKPRIASEKATLCLKIGEMTRKPPRNVVDGSVQAVQAWMAAAVEARKTAGRRTATVPELTAAISRLERFE